MKVRFTTKIKNIAGGRKPRSPAPKIYENKEYKI